MRQCTSSRCDSCDRRMAPGLGARSIALLLLRMVAAAGCFRCRSMGEEALVVRALRVLRDDWGVEGDPCVDATSESSESSDMC